MPQTRIERAFLWSISLASLFFILRQIGVEGLIFDHAPEAILLVGAAILAVMFAKLRRLDLFSNRLRGPVLGWIFGICLAAAILILAQKGVQDSWEFAKEYKKAWKALSPFASFVIKVFALFSIALLIVGTRDDATTPRGAIERAFGANLSSKVAAVPMAFTSVGIFVIATLWTVYHSFTNSKLLPKSELIGFDQYERLWESDRWILSIKNLAVYGACSMVFSLVIGFVLAALLDQKIRLESLFRTIFLYPFALSFIVTGLVWQWILTPEFGVQHIVRSLGWESFTFDPLFNPDIVIYGILIAGLWQGTGLVMCLMLAGLRGIDQEVWKAARVDGIPAWKTYIFVVIPMMKPVFVTTLVLIASGIIKLYDLVVAQTSGGPGLASEVPAKYVYDYMFGGQNLGQGFAASTMMLVGVLIALIPFAYLEFGGRKKHG